MKNIVIFASGSGSNAENIIRYFHNSSHIRVAAVFCNNPNAYVIERSKKLDIPVEIFNRADFRENGRVLELLEQYKTDLIVLAGFLWLIPLELVEAYPRRIINIHPALLPRFGGKGMYGAHVHQAVLDSGEAVSGITIHQVDAHYDEGDIIFQAQVNVDKSDTPDTLAQKIHALEHEHFPGVIEAYLEKI